MTDSWCVWVGKARAVGTRRPINWSRMFGGLTQAEAEWVAAKSLFPARAMPDAGPDHQYPVVELYAEGTQLPEPETVTSPVASNEGPGRG